MIETWQDLINNEKTKEYFKEMTYFLDNEYKTKEIYPPKEDLFTCFNLTPLDKVKVVILGQDPYHGPGQAHGLSFSVRPGIKTPPSLKNIYKELKSDIGMEIPNHGYLRNWATQGVLLLNTTMTVEKGKANSHEKIGWSIFTDEVIKVLNEYSDPIVFILWGSNAKSKKSFITNPNHLIIEGVHPSPLSANKGFFGSKPFSKTNDFLEKNNRGIIDWNIINHNE